MKAKEPFVFHTSSQLVEITGKKAPDLKQFVSILKEIDESTIFYHVHHAFREYNFAPGRYANDFAHWVEEDLGERALAEKLANINLKDFTDVLSLRQKIVEIVEGYLSKGDEIRQASAGKEFYFCRNIGIILKTRYVVWTIEEFCDALKRVGLRSLFFHFFEARLRLGKKTNDFSDWIKFNFGEEEKARQIEALDPYSYTMDELRDRIVAILCGKQDSFWNKVAKWLNLK